ncbi:MAG: hypothetical protein CM15mP84_01290 [Cellvibrionales bacterium]|nr:MAG: hypothetical protein CM15mP84_01290 [Cellvibrionales bacterium]
MEFDQISMRSQGCFDYHVEPTERTERLDRANDDRMV